MTHSSTQRAPRCALTIAGSDSGGGAGVQADLRTFYAHGLLGCSAITALTAQNTVGVQGVMTIPAAFVAQQLRSVLGDLPVGAAKTGMLGNAAVIDAVGDVLDEHPDLPLVVDPVMVATSGDRLLDEGAHRAMVSRLFPRAAVITPNLAEAAVLLGVERVDELPAAADALARLAPGAAVLVKGGHADPADGVARDWLRLADGAGRWLEGPWVATRATHGTGCTLSAAIAAGLAMGRALEQAVVDAKNYLSGAIAHAAEVGAGHGPVNHLWRR